MKKGIKNIVVALALTLGLMIAVTANNNNPPNPVFAQQLEQQILQLLPTSHF